MSGGASTAAHRVVVVGCGFGGLEAVRVLARDPRVDITLVDRTNHHLFQPLLYQVATAGLAAPAISAPIRHILRRQIARGRLSGWNDSEVQVLRRLTFQAHHGQWRSRRHPDRLAGWHP